MNMLVAAMSTMMPSPVPASVPSCWMPYTSASIVSSITISIAKQLIVVLGSVLTERGEVELDAAIMDGRSRQAGAVSGIKTTRAPISLARRLMEHGPHVFLAGAAADRFAATIGVEQVPNDFFILPERRRQL